MPPGAEKPMAQADNLIRLDYSGSCYAPSHLVIDAIRRSLPKVNSYPYEWYSGLKEAIAGYCGVAPSNVLPTNGGDEAITILTHAYGRHVLIPAPTYGEYAYIAKSAGSEITIRDCMPDGNAYSLRYSDADLERASLVWICNPNNPTGTAIGEDAIVSVLERAKGIVVVDEAYFEFYGKSVVHLVGKYKNLVVLRTFSKAFSLAGLRLGYIVADESVIERLGASKQEFNVSRPARDAGIAAIESIGYYRHKIASATLRRDALERKLRQAGVRVFKSNGGFLFLMLGGDAEMEYVYSGLLDAGIVTFRATDAEFTGLKGPYLRVALGTVSQMSIFTSCFSKLVREYRLRPAQLEEIREPGRS